MKNRLLTEIELENTHLRHENVVLKRQVAGLEHRIKQLQREIAGYRRSLNTGALPPMDSPFDEQDIERRRMAGLAWYMGEDEP